MKPTAQIFLCYAHHDEAQVAALYHKLKDVGFKPWMDKFDLIGDEESQPTIQKVIRQAHFFVACVSRHWVSTNPHKRRLFFRKEIQTALNVQELSSDDIFIIPIRLEECEVPENLSPFHQINLFEHEGWNRLLKAIHKGMDQLGIIKPVRLRVTPINGLSCEDARRMIREYGFADVELNRFGKGLQHQYEILKRDGKNVVIDHTADLVWQRRGSSETMNYKEAARYIRNLNKQKFAGYNNWHLPTLEEAMSLMEPERMKNDLYIDPVFSWDQNTIWTADKDASDRDRAWYVSFHSGHCDDDLCGDGLCTLGGRYSVRAVRSERHALGLIEQPIVDVSRITNAKIPLRAQSLSSFSIDAVKAMLYEKGFFHSHCHKKGKGIKHQYEVVEWNGKKLVIDYNTGLMWQQSDSHWITYDEAKWHIRELNDDEFVGHNNWRLPTLEEAMSLMEPQENSRRAWIDPVFDVQTYAIWTADESTPGAGWRVCFQDGGCFDCDEESIYFGVRAVRSLDGSLVVGV